MSGRFHPAGLLFIPCVKPIGALWLLCLVLYYPLRRALYVRSQREFGCPNCGLLLSRSGTQETGVCPHCHGRLIDDAAPDDTPQRMDSVLHG